MPSSHVRGLVGEADGRRGPRAGPRPAGTAVKSLAVSNLAVAARDAGGARTGRAVTVSSFWGAAVLVALVSAGFLAWTILGIGGSQTTIAVDDFVALVAALAGGRVWVSGGRPAG